MLQGSFVAIVTPMLADGSLDIPSLHHLIEGISRQFCRYRNPHACGR